MFGVVLLFLFVHVTGMLGKVYLTYVQYVPVRVISFNTEYTVISVYVILNTCMG